MWPFERWSYWVVSYYFIDNNGKTGFGRMNYGTNSKDFIPQKAEKFIKTETGFDNVVILNVYKTKKKYLNTAKEKEKL